MATGAAEHTRRWQRKNPTKRNAQKKRYYAKGAKNKRNHHQEWTKDDLKLITDPNRPHDRVLAEKLGRTVTAIQTQRCLVKRKEVQ